tara:strand:- start:587 stop:721 length:135 start_codon:yes stop_codon:yes gene_type:complete
LVEEKRCEVVLVKLPVAYRCPEYQDEIVTVILHIHFEILASIGH